jgi:hypothetical protein
LMSLNSLSTRRGSLQDLSKCLGRARDLGAEKGLSKASSSAICGIDLPKKGISLGPCRR